MANPGSCVGLWIYDDKELFDYFYEQKAEIEASMGTVLDWDRLDKKKAAVICMTIPGLNYNKQDNYHDLMNKSIDAAIAMRDAFRPYLTK